MDELSIIIKHSTKYHPQSNPVNRYNREIGRILQTYCHNQHSKWPNYLTLVDDWMTKVRSEVTEMTPWEIIKGVAPKRPIEQLVNFPNQPIKIDKDEIIQMMAKRIRNKTEEKKKKEYNTIRHRLTG